MSVRYEFWKDTGYTESGVERPPIGATLSSPDAVYDGLNPQRDALFSSVQIKVPYTELYEMSYLRATYDFNESDPLVLYGWIDAVGLVSDTDGFPNTQVEWHVDLWRTYASNAVFRAGTVHRRPLSGDVPPQPYPYRFMKVKDGRTLVPQQVDYNGNPIWWFYMTYVEETSSGQYTIVSTYCYPASVSTHLYVGLSESNHAESPSIRYTLNGLVDEYLGLMPSRIVGCFMSPIPPVSYTGTGSASDPINMQGSWYFNKVTDTQYGPWGYYVSSPAVPDLYEEFSATLPTAMSTNDVDSLHVTGFDGESLAVLPWGMSVMNYTYRMAVDAVSAYVIVRFDGINSRAEGLSVTIPCVPISITQNSWSEYMYSGQREYDIKMRDLRTVEGAFDGLTSGVTTGINAWQMQTLADMGKRRPETVSADKPGALMTLGQNVRFNNNLSKKAMLTGVGAGAGVAVASIGQAAVGMWFNGEYQKWEDHAAAHQTDNLALHGSGWDTILFGRTVYLVTMSIDEYSAGNRQRDISMYGAHVTEPLSSCQSIVEAGGPLQITNMTVGGDIPVEAKEYIRAMFSNGVRLV